MKARWVVTCAKCDTTIPVGATIKPRYVRRGFHEDGRPIWVRVPKAYVHAPKCPKVTPNRPGQSCDGQPVTPGQVPPHSSDIDCKGHLLVDPHSGEIIVQHSAEQLTLGEAL